MRHMNRNRCIFILMIISIKTSTCFDIEIIRGGRDKILRNSERCEQFNANLPNTTCTCLPASPTFMSTETDETFKCQQNEHIKEECGGNPPIEKISPNKSIDITVQQMRNTEVKVEAWNFNNDNNTGDWFKIDQYNTSGFDKLMLSDTINADQLRGHLLKVSISCEAENNGGSKSRCIKFHGRIKYPFDMNKLTQSPVTTTGKSVSGTLAETTVPTTMWQVFTTPNTTVTSTLSNVFTTPNATSPDLTTKTKGGTKNRTAATYPATSPTNSSTINKRAANKTDTSIAIIIPVVAAIILIILLFTFCVWTKRNRSSKTKAKQVDQIIIRGPSEMEKPPSLSATENEIYADIENKNGNITISKAENPIYREIEVEDGEETYDEPFSLPGLPSSVTILGTSASSGNPLIEDFYSVDYASIDRAKNSDYSQVTIPMEDIYESLDKNHEVNVRMPTSENVYTELAPTPPSGYSTLDRLTMNDYNSSYQADSMYQELRTDK